VFGTAGLDQARKSRIQFSQGSLQHFTVMGILDSLQLLEDPLPRQPEGLPFALGFELFWCLARLVLTRIRSCIGLLLFDRLALPSSSHWIIIRSPGLACCRQSSLRGDEGVD